MIKQNTSIGVEMMYKYISIYLIALLLFLCSGWYTHQEYQENRIKSLTHQRDVWYSNYKMLQSDKFVPKDIGFLRIKRSMKYLTYKERG